LLRHHLHMHLTASTVRATLVGHPETTSYMQSRFKTAYWTSDAVRADGLKPLSQHFAVKPSPRETLKKTSDAKSGFVHRKGLPPVTAIVAPDT
jgi:hypothetical protein